MQQLCYGVIFWPMGHHMAPHEARGCSVSVVGKRRHDGTAAGAVRSKRARQCDLLSSGIPQVSQREPASQVRRPSSVVRPSRNALIPPPANQTPPFGKLSPAGAVPVVGNAPTFPRLALLCFAALPCFLLRSVFTCANLPGHLPVLSLPSPPFFFSSCLGH